MKFVFTSHTYAPYKDGVQAVNKYLLEGIAARGHEVVLFTATHPDAPEEETLNGVHIFRLPIYCIHCIRHGDKEEYRRRIIEQTNDADALINIAVQIPWTDWCYGILDDIRCRKVLYLHGMFDFSWQRVNFLSFGTFAHKVYNQLRWRLYYLGAKRIFRKYDEVTFLHQEDVSLHYFKERFGISGQVIENAADYEFFQPADFSIDIDAPKKYGVFVGNYLRDKNQEFILNAFYRSDLPDDFSLIFIGSSATHYFERLKSCNEKLERRYGKRDVRFLISVPREETREYIKRASMCLVGSMHEVYPMSVVESMASGVPFISTPVGCVGYLPGGVIVKSERQMALWMKILHDNPECAQQLGKAGRCYAVNNQSIDVSVDRLLDVIS